ncbi:MAG: hypothetical protein HY784_01040, partial [Chloroflexi bacterium]|nr:hypothetical protein [Chloroflexota bacterium]
QGDLAAGRLSILASLAGVVLLGAAVSALLRRTGRPRGAWAVLALSALAALFLFPGYPAILHLFDDPEARAQALLGAGSLLGMGLIAGPGRRLPLRGLSALAGLLGVGVAAFTLRTAAALRPELAALLPDLGRPGPGLILLLAGSSLAGLAGQLGAALPAPASGPG